MKSYLTEIYDKSFLETPFLKYLPWVGKNYLDKKVSDKILIIAESVYNWGEDDEEKDEAKIYLERNDFARIVVKFHGLHFVCGEDGQHNSKIARGIERAMLGKANPNESDKEDFWTSISFHEFVQRPLEKGERPNENDYMLGTSVLKEVIEILKPKTCILFGNEYRKMKFFENVFGSTLKWDNDDEKINGSYPKSMNIVLSDMFESTIIAVKHPSARFSWDLWNNFIVEKLPNKVDWLSNISYLPNKTI